MLVRNCIASLTRQTGTPPPKSAEGSTEDAQDSDASAKGSDHIESDVEPAGATTDKYMDLLSDVGVSQVVNDFKKEFPLPLATALFSFLYHLASYEAGGEALVSCGMMESLLQVINWHGVELEHITVSMPRFSVFIIDCKLLVSFKSDS